MPAHTTIPLDDPEALAREVQSLREQVVELQRRMARYDDAGESRQMSGLAVSMSEREELLVEAERITHMGSWVWELESGSVSWSDELYRILGCDPDERPSVERYFQAVHPDDLARAREASRQIVETGVVPQLLHRVRRPDGSLRHVQSHGAALFDGAGKVRRIVGTVLDVTESREAALEREHTLHLLEEAQRFARLGSWSYDVASETLTWSRELFHILGQPPDSKPSKELFLQHVHPDDLPLMRPHVGALAARELWPTGGAPHFEEALDARVVRPDGEVRHVRLRARFEHGEDGRVIRLRGVVQDVSDATLLQRRLARAEKMETIGRLAGGIAHEFNNILTVIHAGAELMTGAQADPHLLEQMKASVASARELTTRLLAFGRQSTLRPQRVDPNHIVRDTLRLVERILGEHVALETALDADAPVATLDPHLTGQALINLLINARDAMPGGGRIVVSTRRVQGPAHGQVLIEFGVRDSGPGIAPNLRDKIFEPFFTTKHEAHGTGLGLAMVQGAVEQQGGSITFESGADGTFFLLRFPAEAAPAAPLARPAAAPASGAARQLRILVVEDQESLAHMVERLLARAGHAVWVCTLPSEAIALYRARAHEIDLIVSDVLMPEMSGMELVERFAALAPLPKVVFMSGYGAEAARTLGAERIVLAKPFTNMELLGAVERAFKGERPD